MTNASFSGFRSLLGLLPAFTAATAAALASGGAVSTTTGPSVLQSGPPDCEVSIEVGVPSCGVLTMMSLPQAGPTECSPDISPGVLCNTYALVHSYDTENCGGEQLKGVTESAGVPYGIGQSGGTHTVSIGSDGPPAYEHNYSIQTVGGPEHLRWKVHYSKD